MTLDRKIITVIGATGTQGGSVVRSLLQNQHFDVQCITRDKSSWKAKALESLGVRVIQGDGLNENEMRQLLTGSWGIFINSGYNNTDAIRNGQYDLDPGNCILRSAAVAGIKHVVFSSQPSAADLTNSQICTPMLDAKAHGERWGRECPAFETFTPIMCSWYLEDFAKPELADGFGGFPWKKDSDGYFTFKSPFIGGREEVPWICVGEDFGDIVHGIFLNPMRWNRRTVQAVGDIMSFGDIASTFSHVTSEKARFVPYTSLSEFSDFGGPDVKESVCIFTFYQMRDGEVFGNGITETRTAAELKKAAFNAKGQRGREALMTCREWFEKYFVK